MTHASTRRGAGSRVADELEDRAHEAVHGSDPRSDRAAGHDHRADRVFFGAAWVALLWFAWLLVQQARATPLVDLVVLVPLLLLTLYVALPRANRLLSTVYVPAYFFGRTRTDTGLVGDPVNLGVTGTARQIHRAMTDAGWVLAEPVTLRSSVHMVYAALLRRSYPSAPVSPLMLFGRPHCLAYQKQVGGSPGKRHHVRFWRCPDGFRLAGGRHVDWMAGASFDRASGLSLYTLQVTHHIAPDVDAERDLVESTLLEAHPEIRPGRLENFATSFSSRNGGGDPVHTDGDLTLLDLGAVEPPDDEDVPDPVRAAARGYRDPLSPGENASGDPDEPVPATVTAGPPPATWWYLLELLPLLVGMQTAYALRISHRPPPSRLLWWTVPAGWEPALLTGVRVAMGTALVLAAVLTVLTLLGRRRARVALMALVVVMFCAQEVDRLVTGTRRESWLGLLIVGVGVLVLLFLSSVPMSTWVRKRERDRTSPPRSGAARG